ncbi:MAG: porin family protein [Bacteroidetes bacterium]|nr:porin family protein [Bacteroidota bacterium]
MKRLLSSLTIILLTCSLSVQAETSNKQKVSGWYVGGGIGNPSGELSDESNSSTIDLKDKSYHVVAGYQDGRIFAWEMQYVKYGKDTVEFFDPSSFSASANVGYTFSNGVRPFALLGLGVTDVNIPSPPFGMIVVDSDLSYHYGIGIEFSPRQLNGMTFRLAHEADFVNIEERVYSGFFKSWKETIYDVDLKSTYAAVMYKF